jgi:hypothetical protein
MYGDAVQQKTRVNLNFTEFFNVFTFRQLEQRTTLLNSAIENTVRIKDLSIIGAHSSLFELNRKQYDAELVMLYLKRIQQEATAESVTLKEVNL